MSRHILTISIDISFTEDFAYASDELFRRIRKCTCLDSPLQPSLTFLLQNILHMHEMILLGELGFVYV